MKICLCSDIHLQDDKANSRKDSEEFGTSRLAEIVESVISMFVVCEKEKVELIVHSGDLINAKGSISFPVLYAVKFLIEKSPCMFIDTDSNHGSYFREGGNFHISSIFDKIDEKYYCADLLGVRHKNVVVHGIHYYPDNNIEGFFKECKHLHNLWRKCYHPEKGTWAVNESRTSPTYLSRADLFHIILVHQGIKEAKLKNAPFMLEKNISAKGLLKFFKWANLIVAGHFHDPQRLHRRFIIPGALCQHNFTDVDGKRGFWIYDTETGEAKFRESKAPKFWKIDEKSLIKGSSGDYVRFSVGSTTTINGLAQKYGKEYNLSFSVLPETEKEKIRDSSLTFSLDDFTMLKKYVKNKDPKTLDQKTILKFGKKIIDEVSR